MKAKTDYSQVLDTPNETNLPTRRANLEKNQEEKDASQQQAHLCTIDDEDNDFDNQNMDTEPVRKTVKSTIFSKAPAEAGSSSRQDVVLFSNHDKHALIQKKSSLLIPKPQWHPPWKLYRVISGHLGWVRCIDVDPSNEWFVTGATDRIIKVINCLLIIINLNFKVYF